MYLTMIFFIIDSLNLVKQHHQEVDVLMEKMPFYDIAFINLLGPGRCGRYMYNS